MVNAMYVHPFHSAAVPNRRVISVHGQRTFHHGKKRQRQRLGKNLVTVDHRLLDPLAYPKDQLHQRGVIPPRCEPQSMLGYLL